MTKQNNKARSPKKDTIIKEVSKMAPHLFGNDSPDITDNLIGIGERLAGRNERPELAVSQLRNLAVVVSDYSPDERLGLLKHFEINYFKRPGRKAKVLNNIYTRFRDFKRGNSRLPTPEELVDLAIEYNASESPFICKPKRNEKNMDVLNDQRRPHKYKKASPPKNKSMHQKNKKLSKNTIKKERMIEEATLRVQKNFPGYEAIAGGRISSILWQLYKNEERPIKLEIENDAAKATRIAINYPLEERIDVLELIDMECEEINDHARSLKRKFKKLDYLEIRYKKFQDEKQRNPRITELQDMILDPI